MIKVRSGHQLFYFSFQFFAWISEEMESNK